MALLHFEYLQTRDQVDHVGIINRLSYEEVNVLYQLNQLCLLILGSLAWVGVEYLDDAFGPDVKLALFNAVNHLLGISV